MSHPLVPVRDVPAVLQFYVTPRQRFSLSSVLLALALALGCLAAALYAINHTRHGHYSAYGPEFGPGGSGGSSDEDDDDDPSRVDTIYLGGPSEAPSPTRPQAHASAVHPFVVVHLPRSGNQVGQIPDTPAGHLLYTWLAAFNGKDFCAIANSLPSPKIDVTGAAQVELRKATGGFTLLSAREVQPGVLVFRLHDQTPSGNEVLGTLQVRPHSVPASIASFSLRAIPQAPAQAKTDGAN